MVNIERRQKYKREHKCYNCGVKLPENHKNIRCDKCSKGHKRDCKRYRQKQIEEHRCPDCNIIMPNNYKERRCPKCLERQKKYRKDSSIIYRVVGNEDIKIGNFIRRKVNRNKRISKLPKTWIGKTVVIFPEELMKS